ncbi:MAG TPA: hypothetical protein VLI69_03025 [Gammaproteobacteria bacterium]|nr:hypothetical protein [Gammaproteobacteria bacterium]
MYWEKYNAETSGAPQLLYTNNAQTEATSVESFSDAFFVKADLCQYLNASGKMLQLGSSTGKFLKKFKDRGWNTAAYDFSEQAVKQLQKKGITTRKVDLNETNASGALAYENLLAEDVRYPSNIVMVRILEYLTRSAHDCLIFLLMEKAAPGTIFIIAGQVCGSSAEEAREGSKTSEVASRLHPNFRTTFFAARQDMQIRLGKSILTDHILVVEKIPSLRS